MDNCLHPPERPRHTRGANEPGLGSPPIDLRGHLWNHVLPALVRRGRLDRERRLRCAKLLSAPRAQRLERCVSRPGVGADRRGLNNNAGAENAGGRTVALRTRHARAG